MAGARDPTEAMRQKAVTLPGVAKGTSCNQASFKVGSKAFLFVGPGAKGRGFKAMFKLGKSMVQAEMWAAERPERFEVGHTGWVTARFSAEEPLAAAIWKKCLAESHELTSGNGGKGTVVKSRTKKKAGRTIRF